MTQTDTFGSQKQRALSILQKIQNYLANGITAAPEDVSFAESTLGITEPKEIARILAADDGYADGLLDLIISPPLDLRLTIEPLIPVEGLSIDSIDELSALLAGTHIRVRIVIAYGAESAVRLSEGMSRGFVKSLNMDRRVLLIEQAEALEADCGDMYLRARVMLRNARYSSSPSREAFIQTMLDRMVSGRHAATDDILKCLEFISGLFGEREGDIDIFSMISEKTEYYYNIIAEAARFADYAARYSMDYLMSQNIRPPAENVDEINSKLRLADMICMDVFGRHPAHCA